MSALEPYEEEAVLVVSTHRDQLLQLVPAWMLNDVERAAGTAETRAALAVLHDVLQAAGDTWGLRAFVDSWPQAYRTEATA